MNTPAASQAWCEHVWFLPVTEVGRMILFSKGRSQMEGLGTKLLTKTEAKCSKDTVQLIENTP